MDLVKKVNAGEEIYENFSNIPRPDEYGLILVDDFITELKVILKILQTTALPTSFVRN